MRSSSVNSSCKSFVSSNSIAIAGSSTIALQHSPIQGPTPGRASRSIWYDRPGHTGYPKKPVGFGFFLALFMVTTSIDPNDRRFSSNDEERTDESTPTVHNP